MWRVLVGRERTAEAANGLAARIRQEGAPAFVVRVDKAVR
jgi:uroporphyrinogen-III synthase